ncbi:MAG TPA: AAA family ATPase [Gaiellaceae bacterium]|nr:AAA family ATPase [Gaiellaceae bacterium]
MAGRRERKTVTVLFADLAGFTAQAESMDPEDVAALLDPYHSHLKSELERFGGTVEKFIGDAVMAIFGAPAGHEDDPERAVRAAIAIRDWALEEGIELRVGINTGEALVTLGARPAEGQGMAAGDVVNTAARLQSAAPLGGILVGEKTYEATRKVVEFEDGTAVEAKGKAKAVPAWPVVRTRARPHVERVHGATLVGRQHELTILSGALDRARQERSPQLVTLVGSPGIGKSRLVLELYGAVEREPELTLWRHGRCLAYGEGITFWALGEIVKAEAGILEGDSAVEVERKLGAIVDDPWVESHLRPLVGLTANGEAEGDRREEAFTAWRRFIEQLADERPLVLVFEDLHWADDSLLDFVDYLTDWATGIPLLVVCTARPELLTRRPEWGGGKPNALTISLSPLSDGDTAELLGELLERSTLEPDLQSELLARAGGNPLYAEEFVRMLRERGEIVRLPETVQGLIAARLDLLEADQKALVQNAAVVGKSFWLAPLEALDENGSAPIEQRLHTLERKEFVRRERTSSVASDLEYAFRHVLVRDVAYGQIPRADRAEKHVRTARWIESLGRPDDHSEMLAYHYLQALEFGKATGAEVETFAEPAQSALADAGDRATALNAFATAARYYRAALDLLHEGDSRRNRLLLKLGQVLFLMDEPAVDCLRQASEGMRATADPEGAAEAETRLANAFWLDGNRSAAFKHLSAALELLDPLPPSRVKANAIGMASRFRMLDSDDHEAIRIGREALAMAEALGLDEIRAAALNNIGSARSSLGDRGGLDDLAEAARVAAAANAGFELCRAEGNLAAQLWVAGKVAEAEATWQKTAADARRYGQLTFERWCVGVLLNPGYVTGRWDETLEAANGFIAEIEAGRPHYLASQAYSCRACIRLGRDDAEGAVTDGECALAAAERAADKQARLPTLSRLAHVRLELGDREGAAKAATEFLEAIHGGHVGFALTSAHELSWTLTALGKGLELAAALDGLQGPWVEAAVRYAQGNPVGAADVMMEIGSVADEAFARLRAGRLLLERGQRAEGEAQLQRALAFYRSVAASRYIREAEELLGFATRLASRRSRPAPPGSP